MNRLPKGTLLKIKKITGISTTNLCDYIARRKNMSRDRAIELEKACEELGFCISRQTWMFGDSVTIKKAFLEENCETKTAA